MNKTISREEQLFLAAVELDESDQAAFLAQACRDNDRLRLRIQKLLEDHAQATSVLDFTSDAPLNQGSRKDFDSIGVGSEIGDYKLLQEIGVGGMGVVYMAQQSAPVRRKVAIKIIKPGMDSKNVIARFEAERQALAMMEHSNITKVFDAGVCDCGRPYFVMELITGMSIVEYCDKKKLDLRQRLELFFKVCNAVQHAHQKGVIHRDIKPSNIMVTQLDGVAIPKIIDFGIAKAIDKPLTEKTLFTSYGNMVGTPEYMSPEQAEMNGLDVDTCSDVYSLGVVLYELMTGTTPFFRHRDSGLRKFCDAICTEEPELASTRVTNLADTINEISVNRKVDRRQLNNFLRGDVDWILSKCLAKKRDDRYTSAAELANEIKRCLDGEPVLAAAPSRVYRFKKFLARHRFAVSSAAVIAACLVVTSVVSFTFAARAIKAEKLATHLLAETQQAKWTAETERDRALIAQAELQRLERKSRREAVQWQAGYRFMNMSDEQPNFNALTESTESVKLQQTESLASMTSEPAFSKGGPEEKVETTMHQHVTPNWAAAPRNSRFKVAMEPDGNMFIAGMDDAFHIRFVNNSQEKLTDPGSHSEIQIKTNCNQSREYALQALECVTAEMEKRFGEKDLFVAEPKMKLAQLQAQCHQWKNAEKQLRQVQLILDDNFADKLLKTKNDILLAMTLVKQRKFDEAKKIMSKIRATNKQVDFKKVLNLIQSQDGGIGDEINILTEAMSDIFDSVEVKIEHHIDEAMIRKIEKVYKEIVDVKTAVTEDLKDRLPSTEPNSTEPSSTASAHY